MFLNPAKRSHPSQVHVVCVRHGESVANAGGAATTDPLHIELTEFGRAQARAVAEAWTQPPGLIVTSPATRAVQTAEPTLERFHGIPVEVWPVQEITYLSPARCTGTTVFDRQQWVQAYWDGANPNHRDGDDAESFSDFISRVDASLLRLASVRSLARPFTLLFGHGQFINAMRWRSEGRGDRLDMRSFRAFDLKERMFNCQRMELALDNPELANSVSGS